MKKLAAFVVLAAVCNFSFAVNGCWRNGKYVMCAIDAPTTSQEVVIQR